MARLINTTSMTVDGVIEVGDWFVAAGDHDDAARSLFETEDAAMLVGRKSFEGFAAYWPSATGPWADVLNPMPKYVASRSPLGPLDWNATALDGDAVEGVRKLKAEHPGDLVMSGCGELARELIQAGLVDELYFWIHPRIQGLGGRPYEAATVPVRLIEARQFDSGVTLLRYEPAVLEER
jgi:dihydrofolate reductase